MLQFKKTDNWSVLRMIYVVIACFAVQTLIFLSIFAFIFMRFVKIQRIVTEFITPPAEGKPSPMAMTVEAMSDIVARSITARVTTAFMTGSSALKRATKGLEADMADDIMRSQSPLLAGLLDQMPTVKKTLRRNPMLMDFAMQTVAKAAAGKGKAAEAATQGELVNPLTVGKV